MKGKIKDEMRTLLLDKKREALIKYFVEDGWEDSARRFLTEIENLNQSLGKSHVFKEIEKKIEKFEEDSFDEPDGYVHITRRSWDRFKNSLKNLEGEKRNGHQKNNISKIKKNTKDIE